MKRHLLSAFAVAAVASVAGAQDTTSVRKETPQRSTARVERSSDERASSARRYTTTSRGEVERRGGPGYSVRAVPRDFVGAADTSGDDLWRREQMMDRRCGKSRARCGTP